METSRPKGASAGGRNGKLAAALLWALLGSAVAFAAESPASPMVDSARLEWARPHLSPGLEWCVRRGWTLEVHPPRRIEIPSAVRHATEKYAAQVELADGGSDLRGWVAGLPFPVLDPGDPDVGVKIVWNHLLSWRATDDLHLSAIAAESGSLGDDGTFRAENRFFIPSYRELSFVGRIYVEPAPRLNEKSPIARASLVESFREPADLQNTALLRLRYAQGSRADDVFAYFPSSRRMRRLPGVDPTEAPFGQDIDLDSLWGFSGRVADLEWRFLGEREVFAAVHGRHVPVRWSEAGFGFDDVWEPRRVFVVEGTPKGWRRSDYGRRILYVDRESFAVVHSEIYDRGGELWKVWVNLITYRQPSRDGIAIAEGAFPHYVAFIMLDVRSSHVTRVSMPATEAARPGWVVNGGPREGAIPSSFDPSALSRRGRN
jgi:hypothetical protein